MHAFNRIAPHYETLMAGVPYSMWISYLKLIWTKLETEPSRVLEIACGTGRLCRMLAEDGFEMTGVDISPAMVAEARKLAGSEIRYEIQDAADLSLGASFDAAFSFFDSLNNILEPERFRLALRRAREHLNPGGPLLFDLNTEYAFENNMFDQTHLNPRDDIRYKWRSAYDAAGRLCTIEMDFWTSEGSFQETHVQRAYSVGETQEAMRDAGFERVQIFDAYTLNPPRASSDRIHVLGIAR